MVYRNSAKRRKDAGLATRKAVPLHALDDFERAVLAAAPVVEAAFAARNHGVRFRVVGLGDDGRLTVTCHVRPGGSATLEQGWRGTWHVRDRLFVARDGRRVPCETADGFMSLAFDVCGAVLRHDAHIRGKPPPKPKKVFKNHSSLGKRPRDKL